MDRSINNYLNKSYTERINNSIVLTAVMCSSVYLCSTALKNINEIKLLKDDKTHSQNHNYLFWINGFVIVSSLSAFTYGVFKLRN
jgi:hypothetical protein